MGSLPTVGVEEAASLHLCAAIQKGPDIVAPPPCIAHGSLKTLAGTVAIAVGSAER